MFTDMVHNQLCENATRVDLVVPLLETLSGRDTGLKIATMCSGTESPVLALDMLANALTVCATTQYYSLQWTATKDDSVGACLQL
jgi:hypothetical protein